MARVTGPLMSIDASGTIAKTLVYAEWKGRNYCRSYNIPANPQTAIQVNVRTAFTLMVAEYQGEAAPEKLAWDEFAKQFQMSGFNQYMRRGMLEYVIQITTAVTPNTVAVVGDAPADVWTWT
jgi:hypothetical protein